MPSRGHQQITTESPLIIEPGPRAFKARFEGESLNAFEIILVRIFSMDPLAFIKINPELQFPDGHSLWPQALHINLDAAVRFVEDRAMTKGGQIKVSVQGAVNADQ